MTDMNTPAGKLPEVPKGLATKLGLIGTTLLAVVAALGPLLEDFGTNDAKLFAVLSTVVGVVTIIGRMLQSAALLKEVSPAALTQPMQTSFLPAVGVIGERLHVEEDMPGELGDEEDDLEPEVDYDFVEPEDVQTEPAPSEDDLRSEFPDDPPSSFSRPEDIGGGGEAPAGDADGPRRVL